MKSNRFKLSVAAASIAVLMSLSAVVYARSEAQKSDAQKSFDNLKALAGSWQGPVTMVPAQADMQMDKPIQVSLRVTSKGNALVHELQEAGTPLDATKYDHPVSMLYVDGDQLTLIHYCDAGNRPRMTGKMSPDGKTVEFEFKDISGSTEYHMHHSVFFFFDDSATTE